MFLTMQLKFNRQKSLRDTMMQKVLKLIAFAGFLILIVFFIRENQFFKTGQKI